MRLLLAGAVALAGCAHDIRAHFPSPPAGPTGALTLVLTRASPDVYVAIDGALVVEGAHTQRVHVDGLAPGYATVAIAIGEAEKTAEVWIEPGGDTVVPVPAPGGSAVDGLRGAAISLAAAAIYAWIR